MSIEHPVIMALCPRWSWLSNEWIQDILVWVCTSEDIIGGPSKL